MKTKQVEHCEVCGKLHPRPVRLSTIQNDDFCSNYPDWSFVLEEVDGGRFVADGQDQVRRSFNGGPSLWVAPEVLRRQDGKWCFSFTMNPDPFEGPDEMAMEFWKSKPTPCSSFDEAVHLAVQEANRCADFAYERLAAVEKKLRAARIEYQKVRRALRKQRRAIPREIMTVGQEGTVL